MLKKSNNLFESNKTTNFHTKKKKKKKKTNFRPTCLCIIRYIDSSIQYNSYDMHPCIRWFMSTCDMQRFVHDTIRIAYCTILTTMLIGSMLK